MKKIKKKIFYKKKIELMQMFYQYYSEFNKKDSINFYTQLLDKSIYYDYEYIHGNTLNCNDMLEYRDALNFIKKISYDEGRTEKSCNDTSFFSEIYFYINNIKKKNSMIFYSEWCENEESLVSLFNSLCCEKNEKMFISHGDLHSGNIIFWKHNISLIDFDEVCFGPKDLDIAIFIYRTISILPGTLDLEKIQKIQTLFFENEIDLVLVIYYILKVIFQKKYLETNYIITIEKVKDDNWMLWLKDLELFILEVCKDGTNFSYFETGLFRQRISKRMY